MAPPRRKADGSCGRRDRVARFGAAMHSPVTSEPLFAATLHNEEVSMNVRRVAVNSARTLAAIAILATPSGSHAQHEQAGTHAAQSHRASPERKSPGDLVRIVRESTERFRDVSAAEAEGYSLLFGCVSGPDTGAMGLHYVNLALVGDAVLDPAQPEIVIYEPMPNGRLRLIGADYLVFADAWHATQEAPPQIMGQLLHLFESPNRFGLPAFYTLHVWAWKDNPNGTFVNWHPQVSCDAFAPQVP
jgi:hypothetical protein